MKQCTKCKVEKPLDQFRNDKYQKSGKTTRCKDCLRTFAKRKIKCQWCPNLFIQKQSSYVFCSFECYKEFWSIKGRLTDQNILYMKRYHKKYDYSEKNRCEDCECKISNGSVRCAVCHCRMMSELAWLNNYEKVVY